QALNTRQRARIAAPALDVRDGLPPLDSLAGRRVTLHGRFDRRRAILLRGREREGLPGVDLVTPFVLEGDSMAVLVDRGWLAAEDGATLSSSALPADSSRAVTGWAGDRPAKRARAGLRPIASDSVAMWSAFAFDPDSLRACASVALAPFVLHALPAPGAPASPRRSEPEPLNE